MTTQQHRWDKVLIHGHAHDAVIDKLIGDEVMAFFVQGVSGPNY